MPIRKLESCFCRRNKTGRCVVRKVEFFPFVFVCFQEDASTSHGLSCEPNPLPLSSPKNELDTNYENMIENLLLQQVLLYTHERCQQLNACRSRSSTANSLWVRRQQSPSSPKSISHSDNEPLVLTSSSRRDVHDDEPSLCLIESNDENASHLIENILQQYSHCPNTETNFDQNLMDLILQRNRERKRLSAHTPSAFAFRLQWLAIGLVVDRLFFYIYFMATLISYLVTLWLIPYSHPNLTIDIHSL